MSDYLMLILAVFVMIFAGVLLIKMSRPAKQKYDGAIRVNTSDPEKDTYTLELNIPFGELDNRKEVIFEILHE